MIKKIIGFLTAPGTIILVLLVIGLWRLLRAGKPGRAGVPWLILGTVCFYLFTTAPLPTALLRPLEQRYAPLTSATGLPDIRYIVVLSGGGRNLNNVPATSQLDDDTALRLLEGIRLFYLLAGQPTLIMSGGGESRLGAKMALLAQSLGVPANKLLAETNSLDTHGNAREVKSLVQQTQFILVTSASHLPRAMAIFQQLGMQPIPAPADFRGRPFFRLADFFPNGGFLWELDAALHEYLGLAYLRLFPGRAGR